MADDELKSEISKELISFLDEKIKKEKILHKLFELTYDDKNTQTERMTSYLILKYIVDNDFDFACELVEKAGG